MPTVKKDETYDDWMQRCIPYVIDEGTAEDEQQAAAICNSMWEKQSNNLQKLLKKLFNKDGKSI